MQLDKTHCATLQNFTLKITLFNQQNYQQNQPKSHFKRYLSFAGDVQISLSQQCKLFQHRFYIPHFYFFKPAQNISFHF